MAKTPAPDGADSFCDLFPDGRLVVLMRDGRDAVTSAVKSFAWMDWEYALHDWVRGADSLDRVLATSDPERVGVFRFEDLWTAERDEVRRLVEFCGLDPHNFPFDQAAALPVLNSSESMSQSGRLTWQPVDRSEAFDPRARWANWTPEQLSRFNWLAGPVAERFGYDLEPAPRMDVFNRLRDAQWSARRLGAVTRRTVRRQS